MKVKGQINYDRKNFNIVLSIINDKNEILKEKKIQWSKIESKKDYYMYIYGLTVIFRDITEYNSDHPLSCEINYKSDWFNL